MSKVYVMAMIERETYRELVHLLRETGKTESELIREAVAAYLSTRGPSHGEADDPSLRGVHSTANTGRTTTPRTGTGPHSPTTKPGHG